MDNYLSLKRIGLTRSVKIISDRGEIGYDANANANDRLFLLYKERLFTLIIRSKVKTRRIRVIWVKSLVISKFGKTIFIEIWYNFKIMGI